MTHNKPHNPEAMITFAGYALWIVIGIFAVAVAGHVVVKATANLAQFNYENGVYPHE